MKEHDLEQGSDEWLALREEYDTASEVPNILGVGFIKRDEFVKNTALGIKPEFNAFVLSLFEKGHKAEEMARPLLEYVEGIDESFTAKVGTLEDEALLASFDGINADGTVIWEHKLWNKTLPAQIEKGKIPPKYEWQLEAQLYVSKAEKCIFMCSDGTAKNMAWMEYKPKKGRVKKMLAAIKEFHKDCAEYVGEPTSPTEAKPEKEKAPEIVVEREKRDTLPAIKFSMDGMALSSNLDGYIIAANELVSKSQIKIQTDDDFANCEKATKQLKKAEEYIKKIKSDVLGEVASIDEFNTALDTISASIREARINGENQVKTRKDEIRREVISEANAELNEYIADANEALGQFSIPNISPDFANAIKGKKTVETLKQAASEHLEELQQQIDGFQDTATDNVMHYAKEAKDYEALFPDLGVMIHTEHELFKAAVKGRISDYKLQEIEKKQAQEKRDKEELERIEAAKVVVEPEVVKPTIEDFPTVSDEPKAIGDIIKNMPISQPQEESFADMEVDPVAPNQARLEHRQKIHVAIKETMKAYGLDDELATTLVKAMSKGEIPRIQIDYS